MPVTTSAKRALRKDKRRTVINLRWRRRMRETLKKARRKPNTKSFVLASKILEKAARKKIIHKNKAARLKSRLSKLLLSVKK